MNWVNALYELYEKNAGIAGEIIKKGNRSVMLMPVSHMIFRAQVEVTLDIDGNFKSAAVVDRDDAATLVAVTEKSGAKAGAEVEAKPLCDNLEYCAGDYNAHIAGAPAENECFEKYIKQLHDWCVSEYSHPKATAVYNYVSRARLVSDLIDSGILKTDENGFLTDAKINQIPQDKVFVRFRILCENVGAEDIINDPRHIHDSAMWMDKELQEKWIKFYDSYNSGKGLCYLTGNEDIPMIRAPKSIRRDGDNAKLISANDSSNFTYRGRFQDDSQACCVGYETSQKAHNALKWIIRRQGINRDGVCIVTWENNDARLPMYYSDGVAVATDMDDEDEIPDTSAPASVSDAVDTAYITADKLNAAIAGYKEKIKPDSRVYIMSLDSATPGRLAITYFKELAGSRYLENIEKWQNSGAWLHYGYDGTKTVRYYGVPSIKNIAECVYGTEQSGKIALRSSGDKTPMLIEMYKRLTPCIIEGAKLPYDIVTQAVAKASNPVVYEDKNNYGRVLLTACSLVKKHYGGIEVELDVTNTDRSYVYGRLLAVAEAIERSVLDSRDEGRITNAERYMQAFSRRPFRTWEIIMRNIKPYLNSMDIKLRLYYTNMISDIMTTGAYDSFTSDMPLDGRFLCGYECQKRFIYTKKNKETTNDNNGGNN